MKRHYLFELSYIASNLALVLLFIFLGYVSPFFSLALYLFIPLSSALIKLKTTFKYTFIYLIIVMIVTPFISLSDSLLFIIPSLIEGVVAGLLIDKKIHGFYIILSTSLINIVLLSISLTILNFVYNIDMFTFLATIFHIEEVKFNNIFLSAMFLLSLIQSLIMYLILEEELKKFSYKIGEDFTINKSLCICLAIFLISAFIFSFFFINISYLMTSISIFISTYLLAYLFKENNKIIKITELIVLFALLTILTLITLIKHNYNFNLVLIITNFVLLLLSIFNYVYHNYIRGS